MKPHPRILKATRFGSAALCILLLASWVASLLVDLNARFDHTHLELKPGAIVLSHETWPLSGDAVFLIGGNAPPVHSVQLGPNSELTCWGPPAGPIADRFSAMAWRPRCGRKLRFGEPGISGGPLRSLASFSDIVIPLWIPFLLAAAITLLAHHRIRRTALTGRCERCGYDHTGLPAQSVCPECGSPPPMN